MSMSENPAAAPMMTDEFARVYEAFAHRITGPTSIVALDKLGVRAGCEVLDIAAGAGALSGPAAERGATVFASDIAPGMVRRLAERLRPFTHASAAIMNGEALTFPDSSFDAAFSIFGTPFFADFRRGLREQARVVRPGGHGCVIAWRELPGSGPFMIMSKAIESIVGAAQPQAQPNGIAILSDREHLASEMKHAGFISVEITCIENVWVGRSGHQYLTDNADLHRYMPSYTDLSASDRDRVDAKILELLEEHSDASVVTLRSEAWMAVGSAPGISGSLRVD